MANSKSLCLREKKKFAISKLPAEVETFWSKRRWCLVWLDGTDRISVLLQIPLKPIVGIALPEASCTGSAMAGMYQIQAMYSNTQLNRKVLTASVCEPSFPFCCSGAARENRNKRLHLKVVQKSNKGSFWAYVGMKRYAMKIFLWDILLKRIAETTASRLRKRYSSGHTIRSKIRWWRRWLLPTSCGFGQSLHSDPKRVHQQNYY